MDVNNRPRTLAILRAVELGREIIEKYSFIAQLYEHGGNSQTELAGMLHSMGLYTDISNGLLRSGIRCALAGSENEAFGEVYSGLIEKTKYDYIAKANKRTGLSGRHSREERLEWSKRGLQKRIEMGIKLWTNCEILFALGNRDLSHSYAASQLNYRFNNGEPIRTKGGVANQRRQLRLKAAKERESQYAARELADAV